MGQAVSVAQPRAISDASASGSENSSITITGSGPAITSGLDSDNSDWFGSLARPLLGKEPGVALHYMVGDDFPISTCSKYVAKTESSRRQPPGYLIRALLRSDQGEPFLRAIMDGSTAKWWIEFQQFEVKSNKLDRMMIEANR